MLNSYGNIIHRTIDDSYVIDNNTYHVPNYGEWVEQWAEVHAYALAHPDCVTEELPPPDPTEEEQHSMWAKAVRNERDLRINTTDYLVMPDYPASSEAVRQTWLTYRQALRDLPEHPEFPWTGVDSTPWPSAPAPIKIQQPGSLSCPR